MSRGEIRIEYEKTCCHCTTSWNGYCITRCCTWVCTWNEARYDVNDDVFRYYLFPDKKSVLLLGLTTGIISGITSTFPSGLFPNIIDKFVTSFIFLTLFLVISKFQKSVVSVAILTAIGTLISGTVFLGSAYFLVGLPGQFVAMFAAAVLPAAVVNTIVMIILYPVATTLLKKTKFSETQVINH
jgi:hypothetical protein